MSCDTQKINPTYSAKLALPACTHPGAHSVYTKTRVEHVSKQIESYQYSSEMREEFVMIKDCSAA